MATYFRSFDAADGISDWTELAIASGQTAPSWSIVSTDQVQATSASSHNEALTWNDIDADADRDDVEILFQAYVDATSTTQRAAAIRISTSGASRTGYYVTARSNGFAVGRFTGSTFTSIASNSNTRTSGAWYWVRFRVNQTGNTLQARIWADGDSEPGTWDLDTTDSTYVYAGHVGYLKAPNTSTQLWRKFGVGTNGDTAPASGGGGAQTVAVPAGSLSLTGYAPTVTATANKTVAVPAGTLTLTAYAPAAVASNNQTVSVPAGTLTLTGYAPDVQVAATGTTVQVPAATLSLTGFAPVVVAPATIAIPAGSLTLTGFAPSVAVRADQVIAVQLGELTLTGYAPTVATTGIVSVPVGSLTLTGYAPIVTNGEEVEPTRGGGHAFMRNRFTEAKKRLALQRILSYLTEEEPAEETKRIIRAVKAGKPVEDKKPPVVMAEVSAEKIADKLIPSRVADLAEIPDIDMQAVIKKAIRLAQERDDEDVLLLL